MVYMVTLFISKISSKILKFYKSKKNNNRPKSTVSENYAEGCFLSFYFVNKMLINDVSK